MAESKMPKQPLHYLVIYIKPGSIMKWKYQWTFRTFPGEMAWHGWKSNYIFLRRIVTSVPCRTILAVEFRGLTRNNQTNRLGLPGISKTWASSLSTLKRWNQTCRSRGWSLHMPTKYPLHHVEHHSLHLSAFFSLLILSLCSWISCFWWTSSSLTLSISSFNFFKQWYS